MPTKAKTVVAQKVCAATGCDKKFTPRCRAHILCSLSCAGRRGIHAMNASLTPEQQRANRQKGALALNAIITPEQRRANGRKGGLATMAAQTPAERSERARMAAHAAAAALTPEQRLAKTAKGRAAAQVALAELTPERRHEISSKGGRASGILTSDRAIAKYTDLLARLRSGDPEVLNTYVRGRS